MKLNYSILFGVLMALTFGATAQSTTLKVKYEETIHFEIPEQYRGLSEGMPNSTEIKKILFIKGNESAYVANLEDKKENADDLGDRRRRRWMRFRNDEGILYQNLDEDKQLEKMNLFGKDFVVRETANERPWKIIATEQRDILGYTCMKAEFADTASVTTAWFTPQIPVSFGPAGYGGLPGLVLAISVGENRIILAKSVETDPENVDISVPSEKDAMTRAEFDKIREEKAEEMRAMWGGNRRRN